MSSIGAPGAFSDCPFIQILHALKAIRDVTTPDSFRQVLEVLGVEQTGDIRRRLGGLDEEDEFAVLSALMGTATHLVPLTAQKLTDPQAQVPDLLARFQAGYGDTPATAVDGFRCFVEVKSTTKAKLVFKGTALQRARAFADVFGHPLIFAVRFTQFSRAAVWAAVEDDRSSTSVVVDVSHLATGIHRVLWNDCVYLLRKDLRVVATYDRGCASGGISHRDYGPLRHLDLQLNDSTRRIPPECVSLIIGFLDIFDMDEVDARPNGSVTVVTECATRDMSSLSDAVYRMNKLVKNADGTDAFTAPRAIAQAISPSSPSVLNRARVERTANDLIELGVLLPCHLGDPVEHEATWRRLMRPLPPRQPSDT
jgi:hypothetical protein